MGIAERWAEYEKENISLGEFIRKESKMVEKEVLIDKLADWIDTVIIAREIIKAMEWALEPGEITLDKAKGVWDCFLETRLRGGLEGCV